MQRYRVLVTKGVFSRQQGDQQEATYASELANVAAAQRNVEAYKANLDAREVSLQSYEQVRSPMDGVVTPTQRRYWRVDFCGRFDFRSEQCAGTAGADFVHTAARQQAGQGNNCGRRAAASAPPQLPAQSPGQGGPLFGIAQVEKLRVLVSVPEGYAPFIHPGGKAQLAIPGVLRVCRSKAW